MASGETNCQGDASNQRDNAGFTSGDKMRFTSLTYEIIEELRMRRDLDVENERKIQKLLKERFSMGWRLDQDSSKLTNIEEKHEQSLRETQRQLEDKSRQCQVELSQHQVYRKMADKEKESLKEEIRRLQLSNYSLEKKVRESERQENICANEREQHIRQVSRFEEQYRHLEGMVKKLTEKQTKLDTDMKSSQDLSTKLLYENRHKECVLTLKTGEITSLRQQVLDANIHHKVEPLQVREKEDELQGEINRLKEKIEECEKQYGEMTRDKDNWKEKYWDSLSKLDEAHRLVTVHLHNAAKYRDECKTVEGERDGIQRQLDDTDRSLENTIIELDTAKTCYTDKECHWETLKLQLNNDKAELQTKLEDLSCDMETKKVTIETKAAEIDILTQELTAAQAILNKEKIESVSQTVLSMLEMSNTEVQAVVDTNTQWSQTDVSTSTSTTQTINPALCSTDIQTDTPYLVTIATQIVLPPLVTMETQTDGQQVSETRSKCFEMASQTEAISMGSNKYHSKSYNIEQESTASARTECGRLTSNEETTKRASPKLNNESCPEQLVPDNSVELASPNDTVNSQEQVTVSRKKNPRIVKQSVTNPDNSPSNSESGTQGNVQQSLADSPDNSPSSWTIYKPNTNRIWKPSPPNSPEESSSSWTISRPGFPRIVEQSLTDSINKSAFCHTKSLNTVGITIPKLDIKKHVYKDTPIAIDPEEFSIQLTQDETNKTGDVNIGNDQSRYGRVNASTEYCNYKSGNRFKADGDFSIGENDEESIQLDPEHITKDVLVQFEKVSNKVTHIQTDSDVNCNQRYQLDKQDKNGSPIDHLDDRWKEDTRQGKHVKTKKHKMSDQDVQEKFSSFDVARKRFESYHRKSYDEDCSYPKQPKVNLTDENVSDLNTLDEDSRLSKRDNSSDIEMDITENIEFRSELSEGKKNKTNNNNGVQEHEMELMDKTTISSNLNIGMDNDANVMQSYYSEAPVPFKGKLVTSSAELIIDSPAQGNANTTPALSMTSPLLDGALPSRSASATLNPAATKSKTQSKVTFSSYETSKQIDTKITPTVAAILKDKIKMKPKLLTPSISSTSSIKSTPKPPASTAVLPRQQSSTAGLPRQQRPSAGGPDLLQKYKEIVSKIKPTQTRGTQENIKERHARSGGVVNVGSPGPTPNIGSVRSQRVSPREINQRGILKDDKGEKPKDRSVSWNEMVEYKPF